MASVYKVAANEEINAQPLYLRYKGSILIVLAGISWILQELMTAPELKDVSWGGLTFGVLANIVAFAINRFTKDGITPSMAKRLERAGMAAYQERVSESGVYAFNEPDAAYDEPVEDTRGTATNEGAPRAIGVPLAPRHAAPDAGIDDLPTYTGESSAP